MLASPETCNRFQPGNPARPKGSRNNLGEDFIAALTEDFAKHGKSAIETVRQDRPAAYLKLMLHPRTHF
jgi:hypothetical protein